MTYHRPGRHTRRHQFTSVLRQRGVTQSHQLSSHVSSVISPANIVKGRQHHAQVSAIVRVIFGEGTGNLTTLTVKPVQQPGRLMATRGKFFRTLVRRRQQQSNRGSLRQHPLPTVPIMRSLSSHKPALRLLGLVGGRGNQSLASEHRISYLLPLSLRPTNVKVRGVIHVNRIAKRIYVIRHLRRRNQLSHLTKPSCGLRRQVVHFPRPLNCRNGLVTLGRIGLPPYFLGARCARWGRSMC